jgi:D-cysteine desulfhydrase
MHLFPGLTINTAAVTARQLELPVLNKHRLQLHVLRLDNIHPVISGNKWFKLKYHLLQAQQRHAAGLLTYGGAYSNHIIAVACAARELGYKSTGIIRGEQPARLSHTLQDALGYGMQLEFIARNAYQAATAGIVTPAVLDKYPGYYVIPEGGSGNLGVQGSGEIMALADRQAYTHIMCAIGTGAMYRGLCGSALPGQQVIGIPVLKGWVDDAPSKEAACHIINNYHFSGYARKDAALLAFMNQLYDDTGLPTDFVYTGKLLFACLDLATKGYFPAGSRILAIHSGGLQGNRSLPEGRLHF